MDTNNALEIDQVRDFIARHESDGFFSTRASVVHYSGLLYNVEGSTKDPKHIPDHRNDPWKKLFIAMTGLNNCGCYVTSPLPIKATTHPAFLVGGHMTPDSSGFVPDGGDLYIMPLCKWHNSKKRDGIAFHHVHHTEMLKLTGYMWGDSAVTFMMRLPSTEAHKIIYLDDNLGRWKYSSVGDAQALAMKAGKHSVVEIVPGASGEYFLFEQQGDRYSVVDKGA